MKKTILKNTLMLIILTVPISTLLAQSKTYDFDQVLGFAYTSTNVVAPGDSFQIMVSKAAFNSKDKPIVKFRDENVNANAKLDSTQEGRAYFTIKAGSTGDMRIQGEINFEGSNESLPFSTTVMVAAGNAALELPEFNILYVGYNNFIVPSGCLNPTIEATGCEVSRVTKNGRSGFNVRPNARGPISIRISGKDANGNAVSFGPFQYLARSFPSPVIRTNTINKATGGKIQVGMPDSSPINATFTVLNGEILGVDGGAFSGDRVTADKLKTFKKGSRVGISLTVKNNLTGMKSNIDGSILIQ